MGGMEWILVGSMRLQKNNLSILRKREKLQYKAELHLVHSNNQISEIYFWEMMFDADVKVILVGLGHIWSNQM